MVEFSQVEKKIIMETLIRIHERKKPFKKIGPRVCLIRTDPVKWDGYIRPRIQKYFNKISPSDKTGLNYEGMTDLIAEMNFDKLSSVVNGGVLMPVPTICVGDST